MDIVTEKACSTCEKTKKLEEFFRGNQCKQCRKEWKRADYHKNKEKYLEESKDYRVRHIEDVRRRRKDYYHRTKEESKRKSLEWYYGNKEKAKVRGSKYYEQNTDKIKERATQWAKENPDKVKVKNKRWEQKNPEKVAERHKKWNLRNPEKRKIIGKNAIYKRRGAISGKITSEEWLDLCQRYENKCLSCKKEGIKLTVDHVVPISKGGSNTIDNVQPLCRSCNSKKGTKIIDYR